MTSQNDTSRCHSKKVVHLDVIDDDASGPVGKAPIARSKMSRRRAIVLISIQAVILIHIGLWLFGAFDGRTITPVEPSEAMQTLEFGAINAGFIIFAVALLSTLIFGRFFCGWGCHIVMLQDFCSWIMKKCGVRPKPFRSRILIWVPLLVALYMFVWPNFKRWAVFPILENAAPAVKSLFAPVAEWQGLSNHLVSEHFWSNPDTGVSFPIIMAIPTLLIVGFAAVYFLGAKGFCTYGCPYGGFFAPLDEWSPLRIRVNDDCEQCGHCTATCTSNVRVHEEVREYGMVVDPGCMKCMDCVSVCPNDALSLGFGKPAVKKGKAKTKEPKRQYDLSLREDLALGGVFLITLLCIRGFYLWESTPFLMSVGFAGVFAFLLFKAWRVLSRREELVRIQNLKLKWHGRIRPAGWGLLALVGAVVIVLASNGVVNASQWRAERIVTPEVREYAQANTVIERPAHVIDAAHAALVQLKRTLGVAEGGFAAMTNPAQWSKVAAMHGVLREFDRAAEALRRGIAGGGERDLACATYANFLFLDNRGEQGLAYAKEILERHPDFEQTFETAIFLSNQVEGLDEAAALARRTLESHPGSLAAARALGELLLSQGHEEEALSLAENALPDHPDDLRLHLIRAGAFFQLQRFDEARRTLEQAIDRFPDVAQLHDRLSMVFTMMGDQEKAAYHNQRARELNKSNR